MLPYMPYLLGGALFLLLRKRRTRQVTPARASDAIVQSAQKTSQAALQLSTQPGGELLSARGQLKTAWKLLQNQFLVVPQANVVPKMKVSGVPPFGVSTNLPDARQVMILYAIDPTFTIVEAGHPPLEISVLYGMESLQNPALADSIINATPRNKIANAIELLPEHKIIEFTLQLLANAVPLFERAGVGQPYADYVRYLARKSTGARAHKPKGGSQFLREMGLRSGAWSGMPGGELRDFLMYAEGTIESYHAKGKYGPTTHKLTDAIRSRALLAHEKEIDRYLENLTEEQRKRINELEMEVVQQADGTYAAEVRPTKAQLEMQQRAQATYLRDADEAFQIIIKALR